ncbi:MAG: hypothetical protein PHD32_11070 [Eubacteriales bacterium]|nr:hypothetical protein [Eubacteriales bacterium]
MSPALYSCFFLMLVVLFLVLQQRRRQAYVRIQHLRAARKKGGMNPMNEIFERFIGKDCLIYSGLNGESTQGVVEGVADNWLQVRRKSGEQELVSLDFVSRIREYPVNKKGKKKDIVLD